jgi:hypothetical protein
VCEGGCVGVMGGWEGGIAKWDQSAG